MAAEHPSCRMSLLGMGRAGPTRSTGALCAWPSFGLRLEAELSWAGVRVESLVLGWPVAREGEGAERPRVTSEHYWWKMAGAFLCLGPGANCWLQLAGAKLAQQVCRRGEVADGSPRLLLSSAARFFNSVGTFNLLTSHFAIQSKEYRLHLGGGNFMNCCAVYCTFSAFRNLWVFFWTSLQSLLKKYL